MRRDLCASALICLTLAGASQARTAFTEQAVERGLSYVVTQDSTQFGAGVALIDLDGDGDPDCVLMGREDGVVGIYETDGAGHFVDRSLGSGIAASIWNSGVAAGDYDADGDLDLYISRFLGEHDSLYRNEGGFVFSDVSAAAGILPGGMGVGVAWGD